MAEDSFGLMDLRYRITADAVILRRSPFLLPVAVVGGCVLPAGLYVAWEFIDDVDRLGFFLIIIWPILGLALGGVALFRLITQPSRVEVTREGLRWSGRLHPPAEIRAVRATCTHTRRKGANYFEWDLRITADIFEYEVRLGQSGSPGVPLPVREVVTAIGQMLATPAVFAD